MSNEIAIKVENLSKCYHIYDKPHDRLMQMFAGKRQRYFREFWAVKDVSFEIMKGETVGIIGRNGSGKSTLLQMICGTISPSVGSVTTAGRVAALLELGAGFNSEFTGRENVLLNAAILGIPQDTMQEQMDEVLAFSELGDFLDQPVKTYSSGMLARLGFSTAIHVSPEILIIDEALAVGDARFVAKCMRRIKEIQEAGTTLLFVSHDVGSVRTLCQRAIWLDKGQLVQDGDVFPVTGKYMEYMFKDDEQAEQNQRIQLQAAPVDLSSEPVNQSKGELDSRPVTHWGSHKGLIRDASVVNAQGHRADVIPWGSSIKIEIEVCISENVPLENLSIAFSIKDLKGTDLIVSTTHDYEVFKLPEKPRFKVVFSLINSLVTGKYLLVAAVENRRHNDIHYYEYLEGCHYFSSLANQRFFGIFQPEIQQSIEPV